MYQRGDNFLLYYSHSQIFFRNMDLISMGSIQQCQLQLCTVSGHFRKKWVHVL